MPRRHRIAPGGYVYHVINRATEGCRIFRDRADYGTFLHLLRLGQNHTPMRICAFCVLETHWHLVLWPFKDGELSAYAHWVSTCHAIYYRDRYDTRGRGCVYQGRFRSFVVETTTYYYNVLRYAEANALRAGLVDKAEDWPWSSARERVFGGDLLDPGPLVLPSSWIAIVNSLPPDEELERLRVSARCGRPYGSDDWVTATAAALCLGQTLRGRGRPRK